MANSISTHDVYLDVIDAKYSAGSKTAILDTNEINSKIQNGKTIKVDKVSTTGLGNYDRNSGYKKGSVTLTQEELIPSYDRGVIVSVDVMDNVETQGNAWGKAIGELERVQAIPELDAYRMAQYSTKAIANGATAEADLTDATILDAIDAGELALDEAEAYEENRVLFISAKAYQDLKKANTRRWGNETTLNRNIETFDGMQVVKMPSSRFHTEVTLTPTGGFVGGGKEINFMIIQKDAVLQAIKHKVSEIIPASQNQSADQDMMKYRVYGIADVYDEKLGGIYAHTVPSAP